MIFSNFLEQANIFKHQIHGEINIAAAVEDHLAFGFMDKRRAR